MRVLVSGVGGQLGFDVINALKKRGIFSIGTDIKDESELINKASWDKYIKLDITDEKKVLEVVSSLDVDAIIHCAAWTNVDGAEDEKNKPLVKKINVDGTKYLANAAKNSDAKMLYISTDYVFDGEGNRPWEPDDQNYDPQNYYGLTKLEGEKAVVNTLDKYFIVRISWVFGLNGSNFVKTMLRVGQNHDEVKVVDDQIGLPTYTYDLARLLVDMIASNKYGYYHATNEGEYISWCDFTKEIYKQAHLNTKVIPVSTLEYGLSIAKRPHNSRLDTSKLIKNGFKPLPSWKDAIRRYLEEIKGE